MKHQQRLLALVVLFMVLGGGWVSAMPMPSLQSKWHIDPPELSALTQRAVLGDADAAFRISEYYHHDHVDMDLEMYWLRIAAENGNSSAEYNLGFALSKSVDELERRRAIFWLKRARQRGVGLASEYLRELGAQ